MLLALCGDCPLLKLNEKLTTWIRDIRSFCIMPCVGVRFLNCQGVELIFKINITIITYIGQIAITEGIGAIMKRPVQFYVTD